MKNSSRFLFPFTAAVLVLGGEARTQLQGPSANVAPYILPSLPGVTTVSVFTVGQSVNNKPNGTPYRMVGINDGLGLLDNGDNTFTLFMNHEIAPTSGTPRAHHGSDTSGRGAFVSAWTIVGAGHPTLAPLTVLQGRDLIQTVRIFDVPTGMYRAPAVNPTPGAGEDDFNRFCSADLPAASAFSFNGLGTTARIYMNGEEFQPIGRAFGHVVTGTNAGTSYELPRLGKASWENAVANPFPQAQTLVMLQDDQSATTGGQVYMYVGTKLDPGANPGANPVELAGLNNGLLYGIKVEGVANEGASGIPSGTPFTLAGLGDVTATPGALLEAQSIALEITNFARPEDGAWDPSNLNHYYFASTGQQSSGATVATRLWRLNFTDKTNPLLGGTIDMLLDGTEGITNLDNLTIDQFGRVLLQEDPGGNAALARIFSYDIASDSLIELTLANPDFFQAGGAQFQTVDEETSGIIDASAVLGPGWFLANAQSHLANPDGELVEFGQLVAIQVPEPGSAILAGIGGLLALGVRLLHWRGHTR